MTDTCVSSVRPAVSFLPVTAVLEMTYKCSHKCLFCSCPWERENGIFNREPELNTTDWKDAIGKLASLGVTDICFSGGEALLRKDLPEIIKYAYSLEGPTIVSEKGGLTLKNAPIKLYLISNGDLITKKTMQMCKYFNIQLSMSLPGLKSFPVLTGGGKPDKVLRAFTLAKALGVSSVVNITVTKKNLFELYETIGAAFLSGADQLLLNVFLRGGRGLKYSHELQLSSDEILQALDQAEEVLKIAGRSGSTGTELPKCLLRGNKYERLRVASECGAAKGFFVIGPSGYIRVCNHSEINLYHYQDIEKLKTDRYWNQFANRDYFPKECYSCRDSSGCDGGCREEAHIVSGAINSVHQLISVPK